MYHNKFPELSFYGLQLLQIYIYFSNGLKHRLATKAAYGLVQNRLVYWNTTTESSLYEQ